MFPQKRGSGVADINQGGVEVTNLGGGKAKEVIDHSDNRDEDVSKVHNSYGIVIPNQIVSH